MRRLDWQPRPAAGNDWQRYIQSIHKPLSSYLSFMLSFSRGDGRAVGKRLPIPSGLPPSGREFFSDFQRLALESRPALA
jgi:hypothetical protein